MKNEKKGMLLVALAVCAILAGVGNHEALARVLGRLYGNSLHVENEPRNATPTVTVGADDAFIAGTLEVDDTVRFDGAVSAYAAVGVASTTTGATIMRFRGAYTSTQLSTLSATAGDHAFNITLLAPVYSTATLAGGALAGAWVLARSTSATASLVVGY